MTKRKTIEFEAHRKVKVPTEVTFPTKKGPVDFEARKATKVPVHVKFKAKQRGV